MRRRRILQICGGALAASVPGCGEGGPQTDTDTDEPDEGPQTPSATPTSSATPTGTETDAMAETTADDDPTPTPAPTPTATPTGGDTPTATAADGDTPTATPSATPRQADQVVEVGPDASLSFSPETFEVATGDTVVWVWRAGGHNVRAGSTPGGSDWSGTPGGESGTYDEGYTYSYTFTTAGEFEYYCAPHRDLGMTGSFSVSG